MSQMQSTKESINNALAALEAETHEVVRGSIELNDNLVRAGKKIWRQVLVIWTVGVALAISYFVVFSHKPPTPVQALKQPEQALIQPEQVAKMPTITDSTSGSPQPPLNSTALEQEHLVKLLEKIQEAQLKKDIGMFMAAYASDFPEIKQKRESTLNIWKKYKYLDSNFILTDLQQLNASTIAGKVSWNIKVKNQKTENMRIVTKSYYVTFSKNSGKWLIKDIKKINS